MTKIHSGAAAVVCALAACACSESDLGVPEEDAVSWGSCPVGFAGECATLEVPIDWSDPASKTIGVLASRYRSPETAARDLWLLAGGPGSSGASFTSILADLAQGLPGTNIYVLEQRGIGSSAKLECPGALAVDSPLGDAIAPDEWPSCLEEVQQRHAGELEFFTTSAAARDLNAWIEAVAVPERESYVYGVSYGSYLALRYLQLFPDQASGVVLDSVLTPSQRFLSSYDEHFDPVARQLAERCQLDAECEEHLGADPWRTALHTVESLDTGHCPELETDRTTASSLLAQLVMYLGTRPFLFPVIHRLERCNAADVTALRALAELLVEQLSPPGDLISHVLQRHITYSELWETPALTAEQVAERRAQAVTWPGLWDAFAPLYEAWPRYPNDELVGQWPVTTVPILALNGSLDPQTPIEAARSVETHLSGRNQYFVEVPHAPHVALLTSPVKTPGQPPCGFQLMQSFIESRGANLDRTCLDDLVSVPLKPTPAESDFGFGTEDVWGDEP